MDRFWSKVVPRESGCWEWAGARNKDGYGRFQYRGRNQRAHRVAYELACGPISAADLLVCHRCDNPPCVNPSHLFLGTNVGTSQQQVSRVLAGRCWRNFAKAG